jgi:hypothetical protein
MKQVAEYAIGDKMESNEITPTQRAKILELKRLLRIAQNRREAKILLPTIDGFQLYLPMIQEEKNPEPQNPQLLNISSDIQDLKNKFERYLKVETREESMMYFKENAVEIEEIKEVYAQHEIGRVIFWILHDAKDKIGLLEKVVVLECKLERMFKNLNFDYHILPYSKEQTTMFTANDMIYTRKEKVNAELPMA